MFSHLKINVEPGMTFCIVGMGRFGTAASDALREKGFSVIMLDIHPEKLENLPDWLRKESNGIIRCDSTNEAELRMTGIKESNIAIVAIGDDIEASILTTINLKELGIPTIICKAQSQLQGRLLKRLGADLVIFPEVDSAKELIRKLTSNQLLHAFDLDDHSAIVSLQATEKITGQNLRQLRVRELYRCNVIALQEGDTVELVTDGTEIIRSTHHLIVAGKNIDIDRFENFLVKKD